MQLAQEAIDPQQGDSANALGYYVLGRVQDARGMAKTGSGLAQVAARNAAGQDFATAAEHFEKCRELLKGAGRGVIEVKPARDGSHRQLDRIVSSDAVPPSRDRNVARQAWFVSLQSEPQFHFAALADQADVREPRILSEVNKRLNELSSDEPFLTEARRLTDDDQIAEAFVELERGLKSRPKAGEAVWYEWAQTGLRADADANRILTVFDEARQSALVPDGHRSHLIRAKVILSRALERMAKGPLERMGPPKRAAIASDLRALVDGLERDATQTQGIDQAMIRAHWALAVALASVADPADASLPGRRLEAYNRAKDAHVQLVQEARAQPDRLEVREAVVAARLGLGHLTIQLTKDRQDAVKAFSAALDELASLPS